MFDGITKVKACGFCVTTDGKLLASSKVTLLWKKCLTSGFMLSWVKHFYSSTKVFAVYKQQRACISEMRHKKCFVLTNCDCVGKRLKNNFSCNGYSSNCLIVYKIHCDSLRLEVKVMLIPFCLIPIILSSLYSKRNVLPFKSFMKIKK